MTQPFIEAFFDEPTNTISYLVGDPATRAAAVIDPVLDFDLASGVADTRSAERIVTFASEHNWHIEMILETHAHADHLSAAPFIKAHTGARIGIGEHIRDVQKIFRPVFAMDDLKTDGSDFDRLFADGDRFAIGQLDVEVMHVPGHTPADVAYRIGDAAFVGDIRRLIAIMYPVIILDEFQDTNEAQWSVVQALGEVCRLIALADPEQRIYDWIGADPARLDHFREAFKPTEVDLSTDNHRSAGTEIALFGNDVLTGKFRQDAYKGIDFDVFDPFPDPAMTKLVTTVYKARKRLVDAGVVNWSLAILVPTKRMTRLVSDALRQPPAGMVEVPHSAVIELEAAILGAEIIALLMQPADDRHFGQFIELMCNYFQGKGGDGPTQGALKEAANIRKAYDEWLASQAAGKAIRKNSILVNMIAVYEQARAVVLTGDPDKDWRALRRVLEDGGCARLKEIGQEVRNLRILERGTLLRQELSQNWRDNGGYRNALAITRQAFIQEHFSTNAKPESGVIVMNMHKAKGKQFDEVVIFEHWPIKRKGQLPYNGDRIVRFNSREQIDDQARQNFRVSVTRGKRQTTILTPKGDPCVLLLGDDA